MQDDLVAGTVYLMKELAVPRCDLMRIYSQSSRVKVPGAHNTSEEMPWWSISPPLLSEMKEAMRLVLLNLQETSNGEVRRSDARNCVAI
jgi:hypothetical protein